MSNVPANPKTPWTTTLVVACLALFAAGAVGAYLLLSVEEPAPVQSDREVPLGVEQAVIIRYSGPRLQAQPYRPGASVNLRIADRTEQEGVKTYDIRYVVSLPGEFDLTDYLASTDGQPIDDLPEFRVQGLTSLTKDIETRIQEIENVGVHIWHWYYETLVALGIFWVAWLVALIVVGRPKRAPRQRPAPPEPSIAEQIDRLLAAMARGPLSTEQKAALEALLLAQWRGQLGLTETRMAAACRRMATDGDLGPVYSQLEAWLHNPRATVTPDQFAESYTQTNTS